MSSCVSTFESFYHELHASTQVRKSSRKHILRWRSLGKTICVLLRHSNGCQRLQHFMESCSIPSDAGYTHTVLVLRTLSEDYLHSCRILKVDSKPDSMLIGKACSFIGLAVLLATVVALCYASGFGKCFLNAMSILSCFRNLAMYDG